MIFLKNTDSICATKTLKIMLEFFGSGIIQANQYSGIMQSQL